MTTATRHGWVELPVASGPAPSAYSARPEGDGPWPAVLVGMELFGVTPHIERICQRLAAQGYWALAPDFFHRSGPRQSLPYDADGRARGFACLDRLNQRAVLDDVAAALRYVRAQPECSGRVGAAGFSIGGHIAFLAAA